MRQQSPFGTHSMATTEIVSDPLSTEHLYADLKGRSVRGGFWTLGSQGTQFLIQSISTVVLARLLAPVDFGIVAMVTAVTGLGQAFADFGLSEATIQRKEITHKQVSTLFWINVAIGLGLTIITLALAPVLSWFYKEPRLKDITFLFSLTFLICGLRVQHDALLKRQMRFRSLAMRDVASYAVAVPVGIAMAYHGAGYWALVALPLTLNGTQLALSWLMVRWIPGLPQRDAEVGSMIAFGGNVAASYLIANVTYSADNVLVGWYWGAGPLGLYSRAYNLLMLPVRQLNGPASSVAIPALSRVQGEPERLARYYLRTVNLIMWVGAPTFGFLFVAANPVILVVLGRQWLEAAPIFQILAISSLAQMLINSTNWLFIGRGQSRRLLRFLIITSPIIVGSYALGLPFGVKGVALSGSLTLVGIAPWVLRFAFRGTDLTLRRLGQSIFWPALLCLASVFVAEFALLMITPRRAVWQLLVVALGFAGVYSVSALIPPIRKEIISFQGLFGELWSRRSGVVSTVVE